MRPRAKGTAALDPAPSSSCVPLRATVVILGSQSVKDGIFSASTDKVSHVFVPRVLYLPTHNSAMAISWARRGLPTISNVSAPLFYRRIARTDSTKSVAGTLGIGTQGPADGIGSFTRCRRGEGYGRVWATNVRMLHIYRPAPLTIHCSISLGPHRRNTADCGPE